MRIIRAREGVPGKDRTAVCLGFFDGVHIGHARLAKRAVALAKANGWLACAHTFDEMPARVVRPDRAVRELTGLDEKAALLGALGVDIVAVSRFDEAMMRMRAEDFFHEILRIKLRAAHVVVGFDHRFGYRGEADVDTLRGYCDAAGIGLSVIGPVTLPGGELVSSTAIRGLLDAGNIQAAEAMLGRPVSTGKNGRYGT